MTSCPTAQTGVDAAIITKATMAQRVRLNKVFITDFPLAGSGWASHLDVTEPGHQAQKNCFLQDHFPQNVEVLVDSNPFLPKNWQLAGVIYSFGGRFQEVSQDPEPPPEIIEDRAK